MHEAPDRRVCIPRKQLAVLISAPRLSVLAPGSADLRRKGPLRLVVIEAVRGGDERSATVVGVPSRAWLSGASPPNASALPEPLVAHSGKVPQPGRITWHGSGHLRTLTCGDGLPWTGCPLMACKRSGVRIPIAPHIFRVPVRGQVTNQVTTGIDCMR